MRNTTVYIDKVQFSNRLKELFDTTEIKAVALENALGVGRATVSRWRNGHTLPDRSQVKEIADFFGVRYEWLVGSDEYKTEVFRDSRVCDRGRKSTIRGGRGRRSISGR